MIQHPIHKSQAEASHWPERSAPLCQNAHHGALALLGLVWLAACGKATCPSGSVDVDGECQARETEHDINPVGQDAGEDASVDAGESVGIDAGDPDAGPAFSPCESASCDAHADCVMEGDEARCVCSEGYEGDGATCKRNPCLPSTEAASACGEHTQCEPVSESEVACTCEAGYSDCDMDATTGCEVDTRSDPQHCGACGFACAEGLACLEGACEQRVADMSLVGASCALTPDGEVLCWGKASFTGSTRFIDSATPTIPARVDTTFDQFDLSRSAACGRRAQADQILCWGNNTWNTLGGDDESANFYSFNVQGLEDLSVGPYMHACAVANGKVYCWGRGAEGGLGDGVTYHTSTPWRAFDLDLPVLSLNGQPLTGVKDVEAGLGSNCALLQSGGVQCWGIYVEGSADAASLVAYRAESVQADVGEAVGGALQDATSMCVSNLYGCATREAGSLVCWGADPSWTGSEAPPRSRYRTIDLPTATEVACGSRHACARTEAGDVYCWGANDAGQLGIDTTESSRTLPSKVVGLSGATRIYAGDDQSCATTDSGRLLCWGERQRAPQEIVGWP